MYKILFIVIALICLTGCGLGGDGTLENIRISSEHKDSITEESVINDHNNK
ncbi:hypothetical protein LJC58_09465 [Lachnospiraceae bacterium OttesenSCG-928-D06]|nr:hypothetical protein [Lachnospiraceae bacterium OttesenSCG-928-D06]